ncbi:lysozyme inhibitor LprI family protein [Dongia rigui]|uniref:Lysozyme inhibitor LprI family protein n=1 Tax=Dongia rigui TaxID=940149 RepID=A0ABU5DX68_9PROT|nr:lysozyme inhibitor LprI family protein [Dongia rigui]MDY0871534.1 lysozyme inhibitor LprI family protein [Dongia rigui]
MFRFTLAAAALLLAFGLPALSSSAAAQDAQPSFDCAKAAAPIEHAICGDAALAKLDADLAIRYTEELAKAADPDALRSEQRAWAGERANACGILPGADDDVPDFSADQIGCLKDIYATRLTALTAAAPVPQEAPDAAQLLNGLWQLAEMVDAADPALKDVAQQGRLIRLDRHGLTSLGGQGCAGPTLEPMAQARARPLDADEQALIAQVDKAGADKAGAMAQGKDGIAGFCLGRLFALYVPAADGTLLVADASAVYRLQRLK